MTYDEDMVRHYGHHPLIDTAKACRDRNESTMLYVGGGKPHFGVPALRGRVHQTYVQLGYASAENGFELHHVFVLTGRVVA